MRSLAISTLLLAALARGHAIFQRVKVNGYDYGLLNGVRAPDSDFPVMSVYDGAMSCNTGWHTPVSSNVINIPAGAQVGAFWQHLLGGPAGSNDPDNPIAPSHKGPIMVYLAKVNNAATTGTSGLKWFKIASDGLSGGKWAVDRMISNGGWNYFTIPSCIAPGHYLMRVELIALHSAYSSGGAQFYMECAQINVTGSGTYNGGSTVSFPGAYSPSDPGILIGIYDNNGNPNNAGKAYYPPGPAVMTCPSGGGGSNPTTTQNNGGGGGGAALYGQCGGQGWTGPTTCVQGSCKFSNQWYSQCLP